jgi:chromosome partitioning protein
LALHGVRVLVIDLDPQGNASTALGVDHPVGTRSAYDILLDDQPIADAVVPVDIADTLFCVPATIDLAGAELELSSQVAREYRLQRAVTAYLASEASTQVDYIFVDCPPSLGLLTLNALVAAREVLIPIQCEYYALEGLGQLLRNVGLVRANLNPNLDVRGIIMTMYDGRTKLADQVVDEVRAHFGRRVYETVVPRTVRLSEAPSFGQPIIVFDSTSRGAKAYRELAKEVCRGAKRRSG